MRIVSQFRIRYEQKLRTIYFLILIIFKFKLFKSKYLFNINEFSILHLSIPGVGGTRLQSPVDV